MSLLLLASAVPQPRCFAAIAPTTAESAVAVIELFTSEGCSSCPPAEAVLSDFADAADKNGRAIFPLAFHVDYWNSLGWKDPSSDRAFSQRQSRYSQVLGLDNIYTPQMIVNGRSQFVGSDRQAADNAVNDALAKPASARISLALNRAENNFCQLNYTASGAEPGSELNVAVIQRKFVSHVMRGENGGRVLHEANVVRWFKTSPLSSDGKGEMQIPLLPAEQLDRAMVIVYVQRGRDLSVLGAAAAKFP